MLIAIFLVGLLAISAVSASDINVTGEIASAEEVMDDNLERIQEDNVSTTHTVAGSTFEDIQIAIDNSVSGDTIELSGNYAGNGKVINGVVHHLNLTLISGLF